ncbi:MAG: Crp/Fnr family transcriptional regulator [Alphaproteobacteria bacterium]|nr:MAG: Crp/Fnr family transcriptional regulator [Alphaproteobacteria bacterium]
MPSRSSDNQERSLAMPHRELRTNRLLSLLSDEDYEWLRPHLSQVDLEYRKSLYEASRPIEQVYFPIDGVASLVITTADGASAEVGTIGSEGMVGLPVCLGAREAPSTVYVQVPGTALKMDADALRGEMQRSPTLHRTMLRYAHAFFNQVAQSAACAHLHHVEQRCCRWLLMTRDRMPSDDFLLTHEFLGMMLGVRRTTVTDVMGDLQKEGLIRYRRGLLRCVPFPTPDCFLAHICRQITGPVHRPGADVMTATGPTMPCGDPYKGLPRAASRSAPSNPLR